MFGGIHSLSVVLPGRILGVTDIILIQDSPKAVLKQNMQLTSSCVFKM